MSTRGNADAGAGADSAQHPWDGRAELLDELSRYVTDAWTSFEHPRSREPQPEHDLLARLAERMPQQAGQPHEVLADAVHALESSISPSRPLYLAYIGSSGLEAGVLAAALTAVYDINMATAAGTGDALDAQAVRWMGEFLGYPVADGHFTSGGQTSNLTAILAAREHAMPGTRKTGITRPGAIYCSDEAHHSNTRAVEAAGMGSQAIRRIPVDTLHRMDVAALRRQLADDVAAGVTPVAVIATAGTTLTGAVDPLDEIATVCEEFGVWMHVDGAYGLPAAAAASTRAGARFVGLERADSLTVDAHKWMGLQKSCSLVLMRHPDALLRTFGHDERYMLHEHDAVNPVDRTFEYSRPFRALKFWLAMRLYGADQYRAWIDQTLEHAAVFAEQLRVHPGFELLHEPQLSTVCFRAVPDALGALVAPGESAARASDPDAFNTELAAAIQADGRVFLAPAVVDGAVCLRACFVNFRTSAADVDAILPVIDELARKLAHS